MGSKVVQYEEHGTEIMKIRAFDSSCSSVKRLLGNIWVFAEDESLSYGAVQLSWVKRINQSHKQCVFLCPVNSLLCKSLSLSLCEHTVALNGYSDRGNRFLFQPSPENWLARLLSGTYLG